MTAPILAASTKQALWFASRGTGIVCLLLLTASVVLGVVTTVRFETRQWPRFVIEGLHRNVSLLIIVFIVIHVATTVIDGYVRIGFLDAVVPFRSPYRTFWLGLGAVAFDLILALAVTSILRARVGYRVWRAVHWSAYACWPIALVHGLGTGSDSRVGWMVVLDIVALAVVCAAVFWRLAVTWRPGAPGQWGAVAAGVVVPVAVGLWALAGPLQPGWARSKHPATAGTSAIGSEPEDAGFAAALTATRTAQPTGVNGTETISIRGAVAGPPALQLDLELTGRAVDQGVDLNVGQLTLGPSTAPERWRGRVVKLAGGHVEARAVDGSGRTLAVVLDLHVGSPGGAVTGTITARPSAQGSGTGDD